jgi:BlaI family transcriptional regulator, penicillinase repressor
MPRKKKNNLLDLPALELECMKALWALNQATVEEIRARLLPRRPLAYTTVLTVMDRLSRKGVAERRKRGRAHVYTAVVPEDSVRDHALERLIENFFAGSRDQLRSHLGSGRAPEVRPPHPPPSQQPHPVARASRKPKEAELPAEKIDTSLL